MTLDWAVSVWENYYVVRLAIVETVAELERPRYFMKMGLFFSSSPRPV